MRPLRTSPSASVPDRRQHAKVACSARDNRMINADMRPRAIAIS
jgi:hypothetical protein